MGSTINHFSLKKCHRQINTGVNECEGKYVKVKMLCFMLLFIELILGFNIQYPFIHLQVSRIEEVFDKKNLYISIIVNLVFLLKSLSYGRNGCSTETSLGF